MASLRRTPCDYAELYCQPTPGTPVVALYLNDATSLLARVHLDGQFYSASVCILAREIGKRRIEPIPIRHAIDALPDDAAACWSWDLDRIHAKGYVTVAFTLERSVVFTVVSDIRLPFAMISGESIGWGVVSY